jgi:hypothetical protein
MPKHIVADGECLTSIAAKYGFEDGKRIMDHPQNADLKKKRPDGNQLHPGDDLFIPAPQPKTVTLPTGARYRVTVTVPRRLLRIVFLDGSGEPMAGAAYVLKAAGIEKTGSLDGDGILEQKLPTDITRAEVTVGGVKRTVLIGHLNPISDTPDDGATGAQARLSNLGYGPGQIDGDLGPKSTEAIKAFQAAQGLDVTGELDQATRQKLLEVHGC